MENLFVSKELRHIAAGLPVSAKLFFVAMLVTAVLPFKSIAQVPNQTVNNGAATAPVKFPSTGCIYNWVNNTPGIGLPAGGTGDIASFSAVNMGTTPVVATITATPKGASYAYITNGGSHNVSVINLATNTVVATISLGGEPFDVAFSPDGSRAYVVYDSFVAVINTSTNTAIANITAGKSPLGIVASPDGSKAYVANAGDNTISVIQTSTNTVSATIPCSGGPYGLAISPDGTRLYSANIHSNTMAVINTGTNAIIDTIKVGDAPEEVSVSPDGSKIYVNGFDVISVINNGSSAVGATISSSSGFAAFSISPDGSRLYAAESSDVAVIDAATNTIIAKIPTGQAPGGVSVSNDGAWLYVENEATNNVQVYNTANYVEFANIPVGTSPVTRGSGKFISPAPGCAGSPITFTITVNPGVYAQAPTITYSSHQTFITDALITPLVPAGNGVATMGYSNTPAVIGSGFSSVYGVASDPAGNVYITDPVAGQIKKIPAGGGSPLAIISGRANKLKDLAVDSLGNVYFTDGIQKAFKSGAGLTTATAFGVFIQASWGVAVNNAGYLFVNDNGRNDYIQINLKTGLIDIDDDDAGNLPTGIAVDDANNLYIANEGASTSITKETLGGDAWGAEQ